MKPALAIVTVAAALMFLASYGAMWGMAYVLDQLHFPH